MMIEMLEAREKEEQQRESQMDKWKEQMVDLVQQTVEGQVRKQLPRVHVAEISLADHLQVVNQEESKRPYRCVVGVESRDPEVSKQRQMLGMQQSEEAKRYQFQRLQGGKLLFADGDKQVALTHRQLPVTLELRGKLNTVEFVQQMKPQDLQKTWQRAKLVAERQKLTPKQICRQMLQQKCNAYEQKQRLSTLQQGMLLQRELPKLKTAVHEVNQVITGHQRRMQQMSAVVKQQPVFTQTWEALQTKQQHGQVMVTQYEQVQKSVHNELKLDLYTQFPELQLRELNFEETLSLEQAASQITRGGVPALEQQVGQNRDPVGEKGLQKAKHASPEREQDRTGEPSPTQEIEEISIKDSFNIDI